MAVEFNAKLYVKYGNDQFDLKMTIIQTKMTVYRPFRSFNGDTASHWYQRSFWENGHFRTNSLRPRISDTEMDLIVL